MSGSPNNREIVEMLQSFRESLEEENLQDLYDEEIEQVAEGIYGGLTRCLDDELFMQEFLPYGYVFREAVRHGIRRRDKGFPVEKVMREHILLREAFWKHRKDQVQRVHDFDVEKRTLQCFNSLFQATLYAYHDKSLSIEVMDALRDPLTGVFNAHYFNTRLEEELRRSERYFRDVTLLVFELDSNRADHSEEEAELLRAFVRVLRRNARSSDIPARVDYSRFGIIAPETKMEGAEVVALRLKNKVLNYFADLGKGYVGAEVGVGLASYPDHGYDPEALLKEADDMMKREAAGP
jgi:diguanylate cyclase (GGDEF)-like protein